MIVVRWRKTEPKLFDKDPFEYHAVITDLEEWSAGLVLQFHRTRQDCYVPRNKHLALLAEIRSTAPYPITGPRPG